MRTILGQIKQYRKDSVLIPLFTALEVVTKVMLPSVTVLIIDESIQEGNMGKMYTHGSIMVVMALVNLMAGALAGEYVASTSSGLTYNLRKGIYGKIQTFSFSNIDKFGTAGLVAHMTMDVTNIQDAYQMCIRIAVRSPLMLVCSMVISFMISPRLSMIFLATIALLAYVLGCFMMMMEKTFDVVFKRYDDLNASAQGNVSGIRVVRVYVREEYENTKFVGAANNLCRLFVKAESILAPNNPVMMLVVYSYILSVSWFGARFVVGGAITTGGLTSLFSYIMSIMMSLMMLSMVFMMIAMSSSSIRRIGEVSMEKSNIRNPKQPMTEVVDGSVNFNKVGFSYRRDSGKQVLADIDLHIRTDEILGIIGGTGSGKTSPVSLVNRLYDVGTGSVCVGGRGVRDYDLEALRDTVSVVLQKNILFSGVILENLRWGDETATDQECMGACRAACTDEFVQQLPEKYHTLIEQGGTNVSSGQKQRLCITRALLKNPKVLILDDSASAVDMAMDARIRSAFTAAIPDATKIITSQRTSSVQHADHILMVDDGRINGFGIHEELAASNKIYREVYEPQNKGRGGFDQIQGEGGGTEPAQTGKEYVA